MNIASTNAILPGKQPKETKGLVEESLAKLVKSIVTEENHHTDNENDEPFLVADMGEIYRQHDRWKRCLPRVTPFYCTDGTVFFHYSSQMQP